MELSTELSIEFSNDCLPAFTANERVQGFILVLRSISSLSKSFAHSFDSLLV